MTISPQHAAPGGTNHYRQQVLLGAVLLIVSEFFFATMGAASPGQIGPFTYSSVIFAGVYGVLFRGEVPDLAFVAGAVLIAIAGLMALRRDVPPRAAAVEEA